MTPPRDVREALLVLADGTTFEGEAIGAEPASGVASGEVVFNTVLAGYQEVADATDALIASIDLDSDHPLPEAPWFEPGARWTARRTLLHILAETSQHAGHADIIREALDGQKTMG